MKSETCNLQFHFKEHYLVYNNQNIIQIIKFLNFTFNISSERSFKNVFLRVKILKKS